MMATQYTPRLNLPYPQATDAPKGNEQIQALATALDDQAAVTRVALPLRAEYSTGTAFYYTQMGRVYLVGQIRRTDGAPIGTGTQEFIDTWPSGIAPPTYFSYACTAVGMQATGTPPTVRVDLNSTYLRTVASTVGFTSLNIHGCSWPLALT